MESYVYSPKRKPKTINSLVIYWHLVSQTGKNLPAMWETLVLSLGPKIPWRSEWLPTPVFLPKEFHG